MGIGNDIRPRKVYRPHHFDEEVKHAPEKVTAQPPENQQPAPATYQSSASHHGFDSHLEQEFFSSPEPTESPSAKKVKTRSEGGRIFFWFILFSLLAGIVVTEYYTDFLKLNKKSADTSKQQTKDETVYSGEVITQDYAKSTSSGSVATGETAATGQSAAVAETVVPTAATGTSAAASQITIKVLNGNGIKNSAAAVRDTLVKGGFTIKTVTNASRFTYTQTYIYYQTGKVAEAKSVQAALTGRDMILQESDTIAGSYTVVVVVGKN